MKNEKLRIKGVAFLGMIESLRKSKGPDTVEKLFAELPTDLQDKFKYKGIVQSGWYPLEWYLQFLSFIKKVMGDRREVLGELANSMVKDALLSGVYKYLRFVLSRKSILTRAPMFFNSFVDGATMTVLEVTTVSGRIQCANCKGFNADLWQVVIASSCGVIETHNGIIKSVKVHSGGGDGDDAIDFELRFKWDVEMD